MKSERKLVSWKWSEEGMGRYEARSEREGNGKRERIKESRTWTPGLTEGSGR